MRILKLVLAMAVLLSAGPTVLALSDPTDVSKFHGVWIGSGVIAEQQPQGSAVTARKPGVVIRAKRKPGST
jgi:hypothetical protein